MPDGHSRGALLRLTVFDYGAGNLHSLLKALEGDGRTLEVETEPHRLRSAELLVLPGVGAFAQAAGRLASAGPELRDALRHGLPCVGVCLGMQLLFESSAEGGGPGIGLIEGTVERLRARMLPHIGWNRVESATDPLLGPAGLDLAYFANSYACRPRDKECVTAWTTHENDRFPAVVRTARTIGVQFHPEKSSAAGVRFLRAAIDAVADGAP
ncbi:MAG TPA: imidazole glycerol phosphate synthase subunit HisH [Gemmatimonadales bacterium]|nr:imidazole glycerol phosphate synthase subunit HisH [Gemmatimonadales bacterium]